VPVILGIRTDRIGDAEAFQAEVKGAAGLGFNTVHFGGAANCWSVTASQASAVTAGRGRSRRSSGAKGPVEALKAMASGEGLALWLDFRVPSQTDPGNMPGRDELIETAVASLTDAASAGADGIVCRQAHHWRADLWREIISQLREHAPGLVLVADTLGAALGDTLAIARAGFSFVFNSTAWWDFRASWALEQYEELRRCCRTIGFPENELTGPVAERFAVDQPELHDRVLRQRYLLAAGMGEGLWCAAGYGKGMLDDDIRAINRLKVEHPALGREGPLRVVLSPGAALCGFIRLDAERDDWAQSAVGLLFNPGCKAGAVSEVARLLAAAGGLIGDFRCAFPEEGQAWPQEIEAFGGVLVEGRRVKPVIAPQDEAPDRDFAHRQIVIEAVEPEVEGGRFPAKVLVGDVVTVSADIFSDGHDKIDASLFYRGPEEEGWTEVPMRPLGNDRWSASFVARRLGRYEFSIAGWKDRFGYWQYEVGKKRAAGLGLSLEIEEGRRLIRETISRVEGAVADELRALMSSESEDELLQALTSERAAALMRAHGERVNSTRLDQPRAIIAERRRAGFAAWYELFPRSQSGDAGRHGTFDDVIARLGYVRDMGFDVLYFPPIHPIGRTNRKGRNNSLTADENDPGSPYAIGSFEGGHDAIHPELGTFADFERLIRAAADYGLEIALDFAIQCSPDHPWIRNNPEWFEWRPDGSIRYAENPPKKYEDIVNVHFYGTSFPELWVALRDIVLFWAEKGIRIFRVDNPHTKPFPFWEWMIRSVQSRYPDTIFLAEAFTRPKIMKRLAKIGFTQSYSYFTWRNTKAELTEYLTELTTTGPQHYMRPNFFVNTPDINPYFLQTSGRAGFQIRAVLAGTLSPLYGIYSGFELCEAEALPGREEYLNSEKYEIRAWDWDRPGHIREDIALINRARRDNPALWSFSNLTFLNCWNDNVIAYYKITPEADNCVMAVVSLDPHNVQTAEVEVPLWVFGLGDHESIDADDLVSGQRFTITGKIQRLVLDPKVRPYCLFRLIPPARIPERRDQTIQFTSHHEAL